MEKPEKIQSMEDLIRALSSGKEGVGVIGGADGMSPQDRVSKTRKIVGLRHDPANHHVFAFGDVVRHKYPELCMQKSAENPCVFVRYLEEPVRGYDYVKDTQELHSNASATVFESVSHTLFMELDCVIAVIFDDGDMRYCEYLLDSRDFEPHPDFS